MGSLSDRNREYTEQLNKEQVQETVQTPVNNQRIGGRPVDLFALDSFAMWKGSDITSYIRMHKLRVVEKAKNTARRQMRLGHIPMKSFLLIIFFIIMVILGVVMLMFMPQIMEFFKSIFGGFGGMF